MAKRPPFNQNAAIRGAIRRTFSRSPVVREVLQRARREVPKHNKDGSRAKKDAVQYRCRVCGEWVSSTKIAVDHVDPVIHPERGFVDWNEFVERLFCAEDNLQPICEFCHRAKTNSERLGRTLLKDSEMIRELEAYSGSDRAERIRVATRKFSKKKLEAYPADLRERIEALKAQVKRR